MLRWTLTNFPGPDAQYSSESEYNSECTEGMALEHFRIINNNMINKNIDVVS